MTCHCSKQTVKAGCAGFDGSPLRVASTGAGTAEGKRQALARLHSARVAQSRRKASLPRAGARSRPLWGTLSRRTTEHAHRNNPARANQQEEMDMSQNDQNNEAWYDAEIAPALAALAKRCHERGMAFIAVVEYQQGEYATMCQVGNDACLPVQMVKMCLQTAPNVDSYLINLARHCKAEGIDARTSMVMRRLLGHASEKI